MKDYIANQFEKIKLKDTPRRDLLPGWILFFCWLFMIGGIASTISVLLDLFNYDAKLSLYGLKTDHPLSLLGIFIYGMLLLKTFAAYALWFEKDSAILLGKMDAIVGILTCIIFMIISPILGYDDSINIRVELLLLVPYLYKLHSIRNVW